MASVIFFSMEGEIYFAIIPGVFVLLCIIFGILLLCGKCSVLIPGYNFSAKGKKAKTQERIYCRRVGRFVLILTVFFAIVFVGMIIKLPWLAGVGGGLGAIYALFDVVAIKNNARVMEAKMLAKSLSEKDDDIPSLPLE